jgi:hypothetical protein
MPELINLTPHPVTLLTSSGEPVELMPSGSVARLVWAPAGSERIEVEGNSVEVLSAIGLPIVTGLPEVRPNVLLVVSALVALHYPYRPDLVFPATGPGDGAERDERGQITGIRRLRRAAPAM